MKTRSWRAGEEEYGLRCETICTNHLHYDFFTAHQGQIQLQVAKYLASGIVLMGWIEARTSISLHRS